MYERDETFKSIIIQFVKMYCIQICLFLAIYLITTNAHVVQNMESNIHSHFKFSKTHDLVNVGIVKIKGKKESLNVPGIKFKYNKIDKVNEFYTALTCSIAYLTIFPLSNFLELSPLLYQYKFLNNYTDKFRTKFITRFSTLEIFAQKNFTFYTRILSNVLDTLSYSSYYRDTSVFEELLALQIRIHILSSTVGPKSSDISRLHISQAPAADIGRSHYDAIRMILNGMTAIQRSLAINCTPLFPTNSLFYDYYITENRVNRESVRIFLNTSSSILNLEQNNHSICPIGDTLLEQFFALPENEFLREIARTNVLIKSHEKVPKTITLTVEDIYHQLHSLTDDQMIFLFQDSVMATIMKIIFREVLHDREENILYNLIVKNELHQIFIKIINNTYVYPEVMVDGIKILYSYKEIPNKEEIRRFYNSFTNIRLTDKTEEAKSIVYLLLIFKTVGENMYGFQCFQETYKYFRNKYIDKYHLPSVRNENSSFPHNLDQNDRHFKRACDFVTNVYSMCLLAVMFIQQDITDQFYTDVVGNSEFSSRPYKVLKNILHYFLIIIKRDTADIDLLKMAYTIAPILINSLRKGNNADAAREWEWILHVIMAELNSAGIHYCVSSKTNFLLFNQINFHNLGHLEKFYASMEDFYTFSVKQFDKNDLRVSSIDPSSFDYLSVEHLYAKYIVGSSVFKKYENVVHFHWSGRVQSIQEIYRETMLLLTNPQDFVAIYDVYFKFYVAAIYYEMKQILKEKNVTKIKEKFENLNNLCHFERKTFPRGFRSFISDVNNLINVPHRVPITDVKQIKEQLRYYKEKIDKHFVKFNIVLKSTSYVRQVIGHMTPLCCSGSDVSDPIPPLCDELSKNKNFVYGYYKKIVVEN